jgi:long-chain acyl-CoA synthetase
VIWPSKPQLKGPSIKERRKFGSVGFPVSNTDVKIFDIETGSKELPWGEDGEIAISGPQVMAGYCEMKSSKR